MNIEISLSKDSVKSAIKELKAYQDSLRDKNAEFVERLADLGIPVINARMAESSGDAKIDHDTEVEISVSKDHAQAVLSISGREILFIEFGSGIYYNENSSAAHAAEFGYGVGTYPQQIHAFLPGWWYTDEEGVSQYSHGQQATAPVLSASHEIIANIRKIAREVYGSS